MKYLILCEGPNEKKIIDILLEHEKLIVSPDDLIGRVSYHARQIHKSAMVMGQLRMYNGETEIWRIGDKQGDKLVIPKEFGTQIKSVTKYCTLPELEVLLILSEGLYREYEKEKIKSHIQPKEYAKENISWNRNNYKGDTKFYEAYYGRDVSKLVSAIREYKQKNHAHKSEEHYLAEILK